jgi:putative oxidoreductase
MSGEPPGPPDAQRRWLRWLVRVMLGAIFAWAGTEKIVHPADFFMSLLDYDVPFPEGFLRLVAIALPWLEVFCGLALIANVWSETVRPLVAALCLVFVVMLAEAVLRGIDLSNCGCFGPMAYSWLERPWIALPRTLILLFAAIYIMAPRRKVSPGAADLPGN